MIKHEKCIKLICGAGNEDAEEAEKLAYIFSSAGFNMIDLCAKKDVIAAAKRGLEYAGCRDNTEICISIGLQDDIHFLKAKIDKTKCTGCQKCLSFCINDALYVKETTVLTDEKRCIGCAACKNICDKNAVVMENKYKTPIEMLLPVLSENPDCVEFHCSSSDEALIIDSLNKIRAVYEGKLSICINREKFGNGNLIKLLKTRCDDDPKIMIQADGKAMSGGKGDLKSSLQSVAFADIIRSAGINSFLILSGGSNAKTSFLAKMLDIKIDGVALGSYARKAVKEFTQREDFWDNEEVKICAVEKAREMYEELITYL